MKVDVLLGLQWGDEGKGKIVDVITPDYKIIARFQGGPNAGHTLIMDGVKHVLHTIPSGIFHPKAMNVIGNGVVIDPVIFKKELEKLDAQGIDYKKTLLISKRAQLILPTHRLLDAASEASKGKEKIGSTLKGIGPTYMDKTGRNGLRVGDILSSDFLNKYNVLKEKHFSLLSRYDFEIENFEEIESIWLKEVNFLKNLQLIDSEIYINKALQNSERILAEGAQGSLLDIDFGTYPFVTSSNTISAGACTGLGVAPNKIGDVYGIFKAYCTRVGSGPFPTELTDDIGAAIAKEGNEFGATTGRPRRCGWLDLPALKYAIMLNGVTKLIMTKADVLSILSEVKVCTSYLMNGREIDYFPYEIVNEKVEPIYKSFPSWQEDLKLVDSFENMPQSLKNYIDFLETDLNVPIVVVSVGPDRKQTLVK